jgi:hypothetical protein
VILHAEIVGHAALAADAALERNRAEVALQVVAPGVVGAGEVLRVTAIFDGDQGAPVRAAVFEGVDLVVFASDDDDGHVAHLGRAVVALFLDLDLQAQIVPRRTFEDLALLRAEGFRVLVEMERDAGEAGGPGFVSGMGRFQRSARAEVGRWGWVTSRMMGCHLYMARTLSGCRIFLMLTHADA